MQNGGVTTPVSGGTTTTPPAAGSPAKPGTAGTGAIGSTAPKGGSGATGATTTTTPATAGKSGGAAGSVSGSAGSSMMAAAGGGGMTGAAGSSAAAGAGGSTGGAADAGTAGSGMSSSGIPVREDAPTEMSAKAKGKYTVKSYTDGFSGVGKDFLAGTLYYPTDADPPFASVAVVPGFTALQNSIAAWGPFLASHGIVTMTIDTLTTGDLPPQRADELMGALKSIAGENMRDGSPLKGLLDTSRQCVSGWSMGGGGTLIAAAAHPELKCAVSFAAWQPSGGAMNKVPALMFEGTVDPLAAGMSQGFYDQTPDSTPKMIFEVSGAGHDVANSPMNSQGIIGMYGLSWFKVFLEGDDRYKQFLLLPKPSITATFATNLK
jgi:dienelactone hydrolase